MPQWALLVCMFIVRSSHATHVQAVHSSLKKKKKTTLRGAEADDGVSVKSS